MSFLEPDLTLGLSATAMRFLIIACVLFQLSVMVTADDSRSGGLCFGGDNCACLVSKIAGLCFGTWAIIFSVLGVIGCCICCCCCKGSTGRPIYTTIFSSAPPHHLQQSLIPQQQHTIIAPGGVGCENERDGGEGHGHGHPQVRGHGSGHGSSALVAQAYPYSVLVTDPVAPGTSFCSRCGAKRTSTRFCSSCGTDIV